VRLTDFISSLIQVPFLNLMSNLVERAGAVHVRLGGNSQETATLVNSTADGRILEKDYQGLTNPVCEHAHHTSCHSLHLLD
jgi:hypothetical protein